MECCRVKKFTKEYRMKAYRPIRMIGLLILWLCYGGFAFAQTLEMEFSQGPFDQEPIRDAAFAIADWKQLSSQYGLPLRYVVVRHGDEEAWHDNRPQAADKARELMAKAGFPDGFPILALIFTTGPQLGLQP